MRARGANGNPHRLRRTLTPVLCFWLAYSCVSFSGGGHRGFNVWRCIIHCTPCLDILWTAAFRKQYLECEGGGRGGCWMRKKRRDFWKKKKCTCMHTTASSKRARVNTRIRPTSLSLSLPPSSLPLPAVPSRSPAKLGGRCCCAKLALKCLPGSPVSPTTQSNHIRSLYLCLGQVRHCSCVHPRSTFGVEGPPALNVRPQKREKKLFHSHFLSLFCICWQSSSLAPGGSTEGGMYWGGVWGKEAAEGGKGGEDGSSARRRGGEGVRVWHGHPGPRAEQMSATTCFLTPVRVLVTPRMQLAEKFMTLGVSCPPSKTAALPPLLPRCLPSLCCSSPLSSPRHRCPLCHLHLTSHWTVQTPLALIKSSLSVQLSITHVSFRARLKRANDSSTYWLNINSIRRQGTKKTTKKRNLWKECMNKIVTYTESPIFMVR